jgi:hypothetical protein
MVLNAILKFGSVFAVATGTADILFGSTTVESAGPFPVNDPPHVFADSQIRFLGATWASWGAMMWWVSDDLAERRTPFAILSFFFALGGVGRVIGGMKYGFRPSILRLLTVIELVAPAITWWAFPRPRL